MSSKSNDIAPALRPVRQLYEPDAENARRIEGDAALRREYAALRRVKRRLDERPRPQPSPAAVGRVLDAARQAATRPQPPSPAELAERPDRPDRPARAHRALRRWRVAAAASSAAALLLAALLLVRPGAERPSDAAVPVAERAATEASAPASPEAEALLSWDQSDEVRRLSRRIDAVRARSSASGWLTPPAHSSWTSWSETDHP